MRFVNVNQKYFLGMTVIGLGLLASCSPSSDQLRKTIEENPDIIFSAIEKNPEKFMAAVEKASAVAQQKSHEDAAKSEEARLAEEMKNPLKPELGSDRAYLGEASAPITIVNYTDFQCPYCARGHQVIKEVLKNYPGKVRLLYKNLPLSFHPLAMPAAKRFEAIALQDSKKAYQYFDEIFENQDKLNSDGEKFLDAMVKKVGADVAKVKKDMDSKAVTDRISADVSEAEKFGISGTPGFIINGVSIRGAYPFETFKKIIDQKLAQN